MFRLDECRFVLLYFHQKLNESIAAEQRKKENNV